MEAATFAKNFPQKKTAKEAILPLKDFSQVKTSKEGILLVNKSKGKTSFSLVRLLRKLTSIKKIGHSGTLDPFAEGLMVMLIGKSFTQKSSLFLLQDKEYEARLFLGKISDSFDPETEVRSYSEKVPSLEEIHSTLKTFQGELLQLPPMFSAKKVRGQKLYHFARKGIVIERKPAPIKVKTTFLTYNYPYLDLAITCSKGTYIRSLANDIGLKLGCGAFLEKLIRTRSGSFFLRDSIAQEMLTFDFPIENHLITHVAEETFQTMNPENSFT